MNLGLIGTVSGYDSAVIYIYLYFLTGVALKFCVFLISFINSFSFSCFSCSSKSFYASSSSSFFESCSLNANRYEHLISEASGGAEHIIVALRLGVHDYALLNFSKSGTSLALN